MVGEITQVVKAMPLDGTSNGVWGGYEVTFWTDNREVTYHGKTSIGIRGVRVPCKVCVEGSSVHVLLPKEDS